MKWLILVLLFSCGQKNPPAKDVGDSDGDQVPNYLEAGNEKYVAELIPFNKTQGTLSFKAEGKYFTLAVDNKNDLATKALTLLTKSDYLIRAEDYFSELSILHVEKNSLIVPAGNYDVVLSLESQDPAEAVILTDGKAEVELGSYASRMEFRMSGEELQQTLTGKLQLRLDNQDESPYSVESTVRDRTYRVYYFDGKLSKIHYVSNDLAFSDYLKLNKIHHSSDIKTFRGFSIADTNVVWWTRTLGKDKVVVKTTLNSLADFHKTNFEKTNGVVSRRNGKPEKSFLVKKKPDSKYVVRIRGTKTQRTFKENSRSWHQGGGRGEISEDCREWNRTVSAEKSSAVTKDELFQSLIMDVNGKKLDIKALLSDVTSGSDAEGDYLELAMDKTPAEFRVLLTTKASSSFVKTGVYKTLCSYMSAPKYSGNDTNIEGQMELKLESFIEKID